MISLQISLTPERLSAFRDGIKQFSAPSDSLFPALSLCRDQGFTPHVGTLSSHCQRILHRGMDGRKSPFHWLKTTRWPISAYVKQCKYQINQRFASHLAWHWTCTSVGKRRQAVVQLNSFG